jgi:hypothetical protein
VTYYVPLKPGAYKTFATPEESFWCCVGTGMENHAKYGDTIYFHDDASLYINLFIASELDWNEKGIVVLQETRFPEEDTTRLVFKTRQPTRLALKIRYPSWAKTGMEVKMNGKTQRIPAKAGSYVTMEHDWKNDDTVEVRIPLSLRVESLPDNPNQVAILYGPIVLAGALGTQGLENAKRYGPMMPPKGADVEVPTLACAVKDVAAKIQKESGASLTFHTVGIGRPRDVTLIPFYKVFDQRYTVYWTVVNR